MQRLYRTMQLVNKPLIIRKWYQEDYGPFPCF